MILEGVRALGFVGWKTYDTKIRDGKQFLTRKQDLELGGYGREGAVEWEKKPEDVVDSLPK